MLFQWINKLFATDDKSYSLLFLRIIAAIVIIPHGAQKLLGWFGGYGFQATISGFSNYMGIPPFLGILNILAESIGGLFLLFGLFSRISSFGLSITMIVAAVVAHLPNGFFMNWSGTVAGEGFEYHILYFAISFLVMVKGGGAYSLDSVLSKKLLTREKESYKLQSVHSH